MYLNGHHLDTELKLGFGTSNPGSRVITISGLDKKHSLDLTLGPSSGLTTENGVSSTTPKTSGALGIQKTDIFKHLPPRKTFASKIALGGEMLMKDQGLRPTNPVSHLPVNHHRVMPYNNFIHEKFPTSFLLHNLQGSGLTNLHIHEVPSRSVPQFQGPRSNVVQSYPTHDSLVENVPNLMGHEDHSIVEAASIENHNIPRVSEEARESGTYTNGDEESPTLQRQHNDVLKLNSHKYYAATHEGMPGLTKFGKQEISIIEREQIRNKIDTWFSILRYKLIKKLKNYREVGIRPIDVDRAVDRAQHKLTPTFVGFLIKNYNPSGGRSEQDFINHGWKYLKSCLVKWEDVDFAVVPRIKDVKVDGSVWEWSPAEVMGYFMWTNGRNALSTKVFGKFTAGWRDFNGL